MKNFVLLLLLSFYMHSTGFCQHSISTESPIISDCSLSGNDFPTKFKITFIGGSYSNNILRNTKISRINYEVFNSDNNILNSYSFNTHRRTTHKNTLSSKKYIYQKNKITIEKETQNKNQSTKESLTRERNVNKHVM